MKTCDKKRELANCSKHSKKIFASDLIKKQAGMAALRKMGIVLAYSTYPQ
jgi:hypothetical protein